MQATPYDDVRSMAAEIMAVVCGHFVLPDPTTSGRLKVACSDSFAEVDHTLALFEAERLVRLVTEGVV